MNPELVFRHPVLVADACCLINLCASGQLVDILESLPVKVVVADYVKNREVLRCDLNYAIQTSMLTIVEPETEDESEAYVNLAYQWHADGEAVTAAIALHRNWAVASDERRVLNHLNRIAPLIQQVTTPELVKFWADTKGIHPTVVRETLEGIANKGKYMISKNHIYHDWWESCISPSTIPSG